MSLHYLDIMATFQEKAEQEGIDAEEREGTFEDVMPDFQMMMELSEHISVQSLSELVTLSNITIGWYRPSLVSSAEEAQRWMYRLPKVYLRQLEQEHLVASTQAQSVETPQSSNQLMPSFISLESSSRDLKQASVTSNKTLPKSAA